MIHLVDCMSESQIELSIIVAIYNSEKYISECLHSLVTQELACSYEIVLVDDGSADRTAKICEEYSRLYPHIKFVQHEKNKGIVATRRKGYELSSGRYVAFMDGDDYAGPVHFSTMMDAAERDGADVVCSGYTEFHEEIGTTAYYNRIAAGRYVHDPLKRFHNRMICDGKIGGYGVFSYLWNKLFKREIVDKIIYTIKDQIFIGEDGALAYPALLAARCVTVIKESGYHYRQHLSSSVKSQMDRSNEIFGLSVLWQYFRPLMDRLDAPDINFQLRAYLTSLLLVRIDSINEPISGHTIYSGLTNALIHERTVSVCLVGKGTFGQKIYSWLSRKKNFNIKGWVDNRIEGADSELSKIISKSSLDIRIFYVISYFDMHDIQLTKAWLMEAGVAAENVMIPDLGNAFTSQELEVLLG